MGGAISAPLFCPMNQIKNLLLHTCCAPCLIAPYFQLQEEGIQVTAFWYNVNIHPYTEYKARKNALEEFSRQEGFPLIINDEYGLEEFVKEVIDDIDQRCAHCYEVRLEAAAKLAKEEGFDAFSSTLLYSRYQKHELIIETAERMAARYDIPFFYRDWRGLWQKGIELSKEAGMYRQKYCGCIFSEAERYGKLRSG
ncbi:MAG: epoxyqueuosine reductase QueH [Candidatus Cloacimonadaceae bacterium]